jgi:ABC-type multidrug transport system ATPase subunit
MKISLSEIAKKYNKVEVLKNVNLQLDNKKINFLIGENGTGKSTLINLILGIVKPSKGKIFIDDVRIRHYNGVYKKNIGILINYDTYPYHFKVKEYINLLYFLYGVKKDIEYENQLLEFFELKGLLNHKIIELSDGYKQRVKIFASMLHRPKYYIYDEPFSFLDDEFINRFIQKIKDLFLNGSFFLISSHNIALIKKFEDINLYEIKNLTIEKYEK